MTSKIIAQEPIAVVAIACEFAGDIHSATDLWHVLEQSKDVGSAIPQERADLASFSAHMVNQDKDNQLSQNLIRGGYFLSNAQWDTFEQSFFGLSNNEALSMDPAHRLLMLKFVHLIEDAGYTLEKMYGSRTSVHIGQFSTDQALTMCRMKPEFRLRLHGPNASLYNAAARLAYHFNLNGPNVSLDVACSSSLEAVRQAIQTLRADEADMAVCGGVNAVYTPENILSGSLIGAQSPDGRSRSFSIDANGYAKGEGLGLVLLKRLSDAERDGDRIYCILRDVHSHHDGSEGKTNFVIPSGIGQTRLLADIYRRSETDPKSVFYVEAHGTGTPVGDPIEANALGQFFHRSSIDPPLLIGSIKSNLGHTEGAAGIAALIKVAMCMRHRAIPPNMHFTALNPKIEAQRYNLHVVQHYVPFPSVTNNPIIIGINSFGMGGNTTHAIVEEYRPQQKKLLNEFDHNHNNQNKLELKQSFVFLFSTKSQESLVKQVAQFNIWLQEMSDKINDDSDTFLARISKQLLLKRTISYEHLAIFISTDLAQLQNQIDAFLAQKNASGLLLTTRPMLSSRKICFVYSGQGPQWWAMGRQLYKNEPVFRQWIQRIDAEFTKINEDKWQLLDELMETKDEKTSRINDTNIAQPSIFAIQVALTALLNSWQIFPDTIVSHSAGEQAAAFVSGRITLEEAIRIVYNRSRLQNRNTRQGGGMLAVSMSEEQVKDDLLKGIEHLVSIAVINSPHSVTLSGDEKIIDELFEILTTFHPNVFKARLRIENAFHSHQMDLFNIQNEMLSTLGDISGLPLQDPQQMFNVQCSKARLYSSVYGGYVNDHTPLNARHWWANVRECVRFYDAMTTIIQDDAADIFLEISPHPVLATSIDECCELHSLKHLILPTLKRKEDEQTTLLTSLTQLTSSPIVWQHYLESREIKSTDNDSELFETFPSYAFNTTSCWYESKDSVIERLSYRLPSHPLLGIRQWTQQTNPTWRSLININLPQHAFLKDHKIQDAILFPASGYIELALTASRQLLSSTDDSQSIIVFEQVEFINALVLTEHELTEIFTQIVMPMREWFIYSRPWTTAGQDCIRTSGMSGVDVLKSFTDTKLLNQHSLNEFTLHARGQIKIGDDKQQLPLLTDVPIDRDLCSTLEPDNVYKHLMSRGYQYGSLFRLIQSLHNTQSIVEGEIDCTIASQDNVPVYNLIHPAVLDACLHPALAILPGISTTFIPVSINKITIYGEISTLNSPVQVRAAYHDNICGIAKQRTYEFDCTICSNDTEMRKPLISFDRITIQQVQGSQSGLWASNTSVFDKLNILVDLPNQELTTHLDTIMNNYCLKTVWNDERIRIGAADLLPSTEYIIKTHIDSTGNEDLIESIEPLNLLAAYYAQMALEDLTLVPIQEQQQESLLAACRSLTFHSKAKPTYHSTQIYLMQLLRQFPRLTPILSVLSTCGQNLRQVLNGQYDGIDVLLGNEKMESELQEIQSLISSHQTYFIFDILNQYLQEKFGKILAERKLRIFWLGSGNNSDDLRVFLLLLDLSEKTDILIDINYTNSNPHVLEQVEKTFTTQLKDQNRIRIIYDDKFDLFNNENNKNMIVESYDIIFGANKLQGNQDLSYSLVILRQLLVPNGLLLLLELTDAPLYFDIIYGLIDQWWSPVDHRRALLNINQWTRSIREIDGFETVQTRNTSFGNSFIVVQKSTSSKVLTMLEERQSQAWLIFDDDSTPSMGNALKSLLPSVNITLLHASNSSSDNICSKIEEMMTTYAQVHIVFAWSLNQKSINDDSEMAIAQYETNICDTFIHILQTIQTAEPQSHPFVYVLTQNVQPGAGSDLNPIGSPLIGLARSLALEYEQHHLKLIDLQSKSSPAMIPSLVRTLTEHLITSRYADDLDEIVLQHDKQTDTIHRLEWHYEMLQEEQDINESVKSEQTTIIPHNDADQQPFRLQVAPSRFLDDLTWVPDVKKNILHTDKIEVRVHCVGINFRDVLKSSGRYPYMRPFAQTSNDQAMVDRDTEPGIDFIGTVARTHSNEKVKVGDRVFGMAPGVFHSHVHLSPNEYVRIPDDCNHFTDEQLAALPNACMTVLYSLKYRVNLQPGQTVLVHAATGGTGQACIQYCQSIGARVLATAGTDEKRRFLREHYGIEHVFNSRDLSFVNGVRALLPNGVDIIVNSLSGSFLQESVKLLASQGHFIEWGKRDLFDKKKLSMFDLRDDCSFHVIDITSLYVHRRDIFGQLIEELLQLIIKGVFKPIEPTKAYEPSDIIDIFKQCNNGQMSGKFVLRLTNSQQPLNLNCQSPPQCTEEEDPMFPFEVCHQGTILISGGCGGLGLTMSRWMIEKRCVKRLTLMSRRTVAQIEQEDNPEYGEWQRLQQAAKKYDAHIDLVQIDVTNFEDVRNLIEQLSQTPYPIRGIIHSAVVQEDRSLGKLSQENLIHVLGPKARGAWNLHRASELAAPSLHFFVLFSSIRNHMIDLASGGYNAGNQFLDILARYRAEKLNLPALSVSLPAVSGAGMFHRHREMLTSLQNTSGFELVPTVGVFELIDRFHVNQKSCPCPIIFAANWKQLYENRDKLVTHQLRKIAIQQYTIANGSSMLTISSDDVDSFDSIYDKLETIVERTQITVARLLGASSNDQISLDRSLVSQGMDSLAAVSLYNWLGQETNIFIPLADLLQGLSIQTIAEQVHKKLHKKKRTDTESNDSGIDFHIESIEDNETNLSNNLSYTGTENILCIRRPINSECPILFYILPNSTSDNTHMPEIIVEKISKNNNSPLPAAIYTINKPQASMTKDITKIANMMIAQMRRIQPYGPYKLVTTRGEQGEVVAGEMTNQLKRHSVDSTIQLLS